MSFILDALRKSENERKRSEMPGLADSRVHKHDKSRKLWIPLVALLVGINLSLLIVMWLTSNRGPAVQQVVVATPARPPVTAPVTATAAPTVKPRQPAAVVAEPPRSLLDELEQDESSPARFASIRQEPAPVAKNVPPPATSKSSEQLPTLLELTLNNEINLPPLHLDIHVYSEQLDERFVFINMSKYRQGESISEGPSITEITSTGVIMNHQGTRFLLLRD